MYFRDKVVWITGASSGIGEETAYLFARQNAKLVISSQMTAELIKVKERCLLLCSDCIEIVFDLLDTSLVSEKVEEVIKRYGRIDILINCGGISQRSLASETPVEIDRKIMEINFFGAVALTKACIPYMIKNNEGHIAVISSITGKFGFPLRSAYSASKHALFGFFDSLRIELANTNIKVTIFLPGRIKTNISFNSLTKEGQLYGKMDDGQNTGMPAEKCAGKILKAIQNKKREVLIGNKEILMVYIKRFFPGIFFKIAQRIKPT
jgi:dehydrogenase/reductase SDR family member 7B